MTDEVGLIAGLIEVIGIPQNFAGWIVIYTIGGIIFMMLLAIIASFLFRRW